MKIRTEARREAILQIAAEVFLEKGFERASMSEIAQKVGGSKATLYGYFPSKETLFVAVAVAEGEKHMAAAQTDLVAGGTTALRSALTRFAETVLRFLTSDAACASQRMVIAEAGRSDIGEMFYDTGPRPSLQTLADVLSAAMDRGELRRDDPWIAALHFAGLSTAEIQHRLFYRAQDRLSDKQMNAIATRAVEVFMRGYSPL